MVVDVNRHGLSSVRMIAPNVVTTDGASCIHMKPLVDTMFVEVVKTTAEPNASLKTLLANRTIRILGHFHVTLCCSRNLLSGWNNWNWVEEVSAGIHGNRQGGSCRRLCYENTKNSQHRRVVPHVCGNNVIACLSVQEPNARIKRAVCLKHSLKDIQNVRVHLCFLYRPLRKPLSHQK